MPRNPLIESTEEPMPSLPPYVCPDHRDQRLESIESGLRCPTCARVFPIEDGVPDFCREPVYWGEFSQEKSDRLLATARQDGWQAAVKAVLADKPALHSYILDSRRANHFHLLPTTHRGRLLDIGTGWGCLADACSHIFEEVHTIEAVPVRRRFSQLRFSQQQLANVHPAQASVFELPYPDGYFDVINMNGILEWIGDWNRSMPPTQAQQATLCTALRLLRPGGILVIGIENRFGFTFFLGRKDHRNVWGTNLLPRWAANLVFKWKLKDRYLVYTYSLNALRRLVHSAGFRRTDCYAPLPNYNWPLTVLSLESPAAFSEYLSRRAPTTWKRAIGLPVARAMNSIGLLKFFVPDFFVFAIKDS